MKTTLMPTRRMAQIVAAGLALSAAFAATGPAFAQEAAGAGGRADPEFLGIDLDNGGVYYNGRNSGQYCLYRTVQVFNRYTGYPELRRVRRCGRGLYLR